MINNQSNSLNNGIKAKDEMERYMQYLGNFKVCLVLIVYYVNNL